MMIFQFLIRSFASEELILSIITIYPSEDKFESDMKTRRN